MKEIGLVEWLDDLAAKQPTPGGGAAAGLAAATAAALVGMVSIYTTGEKWASQSERMQAVHDEAASLRQESLQLMEADAEAFGAVGAAYGLPKNTDDEKEVRKAAIQAALIGAAEPPRWTAEVAAKVLSLAEELVEAGNPNVISDVAVAGTFVRAALDAAIDNIQINERLITDEAIKTTLQNAITVAESNIQKADAVVAAVRARTNQ